jgi:hypothetical protein
MTARTWPEQNNGTVRLVVEPGDRGAALHVSYADHELDRELCVLFTRNELVRLVRELLAALRVG